MDNALCSTLHLKQSRDNCAEPNRVEYLMAESVSNVHAFDQSALRCQRDVPKLLEVVDQGLHDPYEELL